MSKSEPTQPARTEVGLRLGEMLPGSMDNGGPGVPVTGGISRKIATAPPYVRAGLDAYRAALNKRQDWHAAVWAAIDAAVIAREATNDDA